MRSSIWLLFVVMCVAATLQPVVGAVTTPEQTVEGRVLVGSSDGPELTRTARIGNGEVTNGVFGYVITVSPVTARGRFQLKELPGAVVDGELAIQFYTDFEAGSVCASHIPVTDAGGTICGTHALVWTPTGLDVPFRYEGSIRATDDGSGCAPLAPAVEPGVDLEPDGTHLPLGGGPVVDIAFAPEGSVAYATNTAMNRVERIDLLTPALRDPVPVGPDPTGLDVDPDGGLVYVANSFSESLSVVDPHEGRQVDRIDVVPPDQRGERPYDLVVLDDERILFGTYPTKDFGGSLFVLDIASRTVTERKQLPYGGTTEPVLERSTDRSRAAIIVSGDSHGPVLWYDARTDAFTLKLAGGTNHHVATDRTGDRMLVGTTAKVVDRELRTEGRFKLAPASAVAVDPCGRRGYRLTQENVEILDLDRFLVMGSYQLADAAAHVGALDVSADGSWLVAGTETGVTVIDLSNEPFTASAPPSAAPDAPGFVGVPGGRVGRMVFSSDGTRAYATNPTLNQVEVLDLTMGTLLDPIPSGASPHGLDLTTDERSLVVADSAGEFVSVLDIEGRRIDRRISVGWSPSAYQGPFEVAVTGDNRALVTLTMDAAGYGSWMDVDLGSDSSAIREDVPSGRELGAMARSLDRRYVAVAEKGSFGVIRVYDSEADTVGPSRGVGSFTFCLAADADGDRFLIDGNTVLDRQQNIVGSISGFSQGCAIAPDGRTGYRVVAGEVEILDLEGFRIAGTRPLPDGFDHRGSLALSPDGSTLLAATDTGIAIVDVSAG